MTSSPDAPVNDSDRQTFEVFFANLNSAIEALLDKGNSSPVILIDGPAAAGKSTLAKQLQDALFRLGDGAPRVVHMDDLYPGWDGLAVGAEYLVRRILTPLSQGSSASWQEFDWALGRREEWREFSGGTPLIVEGCGSLSSNASALADIRVWIDAPEAIRLERWLAREGNDDHWLAWRAQELDFYARERSAELANLTWSHGGGSRSSAK